MINKLSIRFIIIMTVVLVFGFSFLFAISASAEKSVEASNKQKYFTSVYIESGETLWNLASTYADEDFYSNRFEYIKEIKKMNNLKTNTIKQGTYLLVTYYK